MEQEEEEEKRLRWNTKEVLMIDIDHFPYHPKNTLWAEFWVLCVGTMMNKTVMVSAHRELAFWMEEGKNEQIIKKTNQVQLRGMKGI